MSGQAQLAAPCRLAALQPEYADAHEHCRGTETVTIPGIGGGSFTAQRCDCQCHQRRNEADR